MAEGNPLAGRPGRFAMNVGLPRVGQEGDFQLLSRSIGSAMDGEVPAIDDSGNHNTPHGPSTALVIGETGYCALLV